MVEEKQAVRRSYCELGGRVGGWVGGWGCFLTSSGAGVGEGRHVLRAEEEGTEVAPVS